MSEALAARLAQRIRLVSYALHEEAAEPFKRVVLVDGSPWDLATYSERLQAARDEDNSREAYRLLGATL